MPCYLLLGEIVLDSSLTSRFLKACQMGNMSQVRALIEEIKKEEFDLKCLHDNSGNTCFHLAASNGHKDVIKYLIDQKLPIDSLNKAKMSPLYVSAFKGYAEIVKIFLQNKADPSLLQNILYEGYIMKKVFNLDEFGYIDKLEKSRGLNILHLAAFHGYIDILEILFHHDLWNINAKTSNATFNSRALANETMLFLASSKGHEKVVKFLNAFPMGIQLSNFNIRSYYEPLISFNYIVLHFHTILWL